MIYDSQPTYDAISIPSKPKSNNTIRNVLLTISAMASFLAAYFLYSGYFVLNGPVSRIRLSSEPIIIEYDADSVTDHESLKPGSDAWIQFHDELMEKAGYNAHELRNGNAAVSFVAYDSADSVEAEGKKNKIQNRPSRAITCYTAYSDFGETDVQHCEPTKKISNPIRTGCSSLSDVDLSAGVTGAVPVGANGCASAVQTERVSARCCQPTPGCGYESSAWTVSPAESSSSELGCTSAKCETGQSLIGCSGSTTEMSEFGGVQNNGNECRGQRNGADGDLKIGAMCADQPEGSAELKCQYVDAMDSQLADHLGNYISQVECPVKTVMFDCNSFLNGRIDNCATSSNTATLFGEYYLKFMPKMKVQCTASANSQSVRAQATCCELPEILV